MKTNKKYEINNIKKLLVLNENITNFNLDFEIISEDNMPFYALIIDNDTLNSEIKPEYQFVKDGIISGNVINDNNIYKTYYLLLKSDEPTVCEVKLDITEIPGKKQKNTKNINNDDTNWPIVILGTMLLIGVGLWIFLGPFKKYKRNNLNDNNVEIINNINTDTPLLENPLTNNNVVSNVEIQIPDMIENNNLPNELTVPSIFNKKLDYIFKENNL